MKFLDEFRDPRLATELLAQIRRTATRPHVLMEVCGGQTHSLLRYGLTEELDGVVEMLHGPGCPVCVTSITAIDFAQRLARRPRTILASFGDMLRVPGSSGSLLETRAQGGRIQLVYSPLDAVELARSQPDEHVVFFAVGFETTAPVTALAVRQAHQLGLDNFSLLVAHVRVLPAMRLLMSMPDCRVEGFLAAGHVCTVTGFDEYESFAQQHRTPVVVTGFEPVDLLSGILTCVEQLESGVSTVSNRYARSVRPDGNPAARALIAAVYEVGDRDWRGIGPIPDSGLKLRSEWQAFDAEHRFASELEAALTLTSSTNCDSHCGAVLSGRLQPSTCPEFGRRCTPESPLGAPMTSSEGACAAYFRYRRHTDQSAGR